MECVLVKASYPRSGTTWVALLLGHHYGLGSISVYDKHVKSRRDPRRNTDWVRDSLRTGKKGTVLKTHELTAPRRFNRLPALLVFRDVRDAVVSYAHYTIKIWGSKKPFLRLLKEYAISPQWSKMLEAWLGRGAIPLKYEDLVADPFGALQAAMKQALPDLEPVTDAPLPVSFDVAHKWTPFFFRRGIVGAYKDEMPDNIQRICCDTHRRWMERLGYLRRQ